MTSFDTMTDDELARQIEQLKQELATRQTRRAVEAELTQTVDRLRASTGPAMEGEWKTDRVSVCPDCVTINTAPTDKD